MRLLRSPWFVGILAVVAVFMVFYNVFRPQWNRWRARVGSSNSQTAIVAEQTGIAKPLVAPVAPQAVVAPPRIPSVYAPGPKSAGQTRDTIDIDYVTNHFRQWVDAPHRDPFLAPNSFTLAGATNLLTEGTNPVPSWTLSGIWRQTGGQLAAINGQVYAEGDEIQGWRIEKIDVDQVWFRGTNRLERLRFKQFQAIPPPVQEPPPSHRLGPKPRPMREHTVVPDLIL